MLKISTNVTGINNIQKTIDFIDKMKSMKQDTDFQKFIQDKCMETLNQVMDERLIGGTTNDDSIELYRNSNHIIDDTEGFIIYNDAKIPANLKDPSTYPGEQFSIALAFEYGVGIIGENTVNENAWAYNINNYNFGWYFKDTDGKYHQTGGYQGFEVYRFTVDKIQKNINSWVYEYYRKAGK